jgi:hypothetical protein
MKRASPTCEAKHEARRMTLCFSDVCALFNEPISVAASELGVSESHLKRQCRIIGIERWPQRKIKSLSESVERLKTLDQTPQITRKIASIQVEIDKLFEDPRKKSDQFSIKNEAENDQTVENRSEHSPKRKKTSPSPTSPIQGEPKKVYDYERIPFLQLDVTSVLQILHSNSETTTTDPQTQLKQHNTNKQF